MDNPQVEPGTVNRPLLIGWKEYVDLTEWKIGRVKVKIDTGARTSALDVLGYDLRQTPHQGLIAELRLALKRKQPGRVKVIQAPVLGTVVVRHPNGNSEQRPVIETLVRLGPITKRVRVTLTNRRQMLFRMILGRKALEGDFLVDVSKKYLLRP
jgi:hypothetical protein